MGIKSVVGLGLVVYGAYFLVAGQDALLLAEHHISQTEASMCLSGATGHLPEKKAPVCAALFTSPGLVVKKSDGMNASMVGIPVSYMEMRKIYGAISNRNPGYLATVPAFDNWWDGLPTVGG